MGQLVPKFQVELRRGRPSPTIRRDRKLDASTFQKV